jgi:hypothetical protein
MLYYLMTPITPIVTRENVHANVAPYWHESTQTFFRSYHGYEMEYWDWVYGEWVDAEDASMYPHHISDAKQIEGGDE